MILISWFVTSATTINNRGMSRMKNDSPNQIQYMPIGLCLGLSIGVAIGAAMGNISVGMCLGLGIGLCFGSALDNANRAKNEKAEDDKKEKQ